MKNETLLENINSSINDTTFIFDAGTGELVLWNDALRHISGYSDEELSGEQAFAKLFSEEDRQLMKNAIETNAGAGAASCAAQLITKDNQRVRTEYSLSIVKNPSTGRTCALAVGRGSDSRPQAEAELLELQNRYSTLVESTSDMVFLVDMEGCVSSCNSYVKRHFEIDSVSDIEKLRLPLCFFWCGDSIHAVSDAIEQVKAGAKEKALQAICFDNYYELKIAPLKNGNELTGMMCVGVDITERKKADAALQAGKEKYQGIFDESVATIYIFDENKNFIDSNQAGLNLLGYSREELLSMSIPDVDADPVAVLPAHEQLLSGDRLVDYEHRLKRKNGEIITVLNNSRPITDKNGNVAGMLSTLIDVTQRNRMQAEKIELEKQLLQLQKMEAIGQLAGGIAHDFNSIITIISGSAEMIAKATPADAPIINNLERIKKAARRAKDITMKLLTFARKEKLNIKLIPAEEIVSEVIDMVKSAAAGKIAIAATCETGDAWIDADSNQILQALLNITLNACDAMPDGGDLKINIRKTAPGCAIASEKGAADCEYVVISVQDTGTGIDKEDVGKIFDPFFTTKDKGKGSGLGLSVCHGIIKEHRGFIDVQTAPGKGTAFSVYLPAASPAKAEEEQDETSRDTKRLHGNILIIDDDRDFVQMMREALEIEGFVAHAAISGKEAVEYYKNKGRDINVILLDMLLPEMSGAAIYRELKKLNPEAKIVLCSGYSVEGEASALLNQGAKAFIQKPFDISDVVDVISGLL